MAMTPGSGSKREAARASSTRVLSSLAMGLALAFGAGGAFAQQAADQPAAAQATAPTSGGLQEVVVTATKRAENIQNVPISVQAFTTSELQEKNITDLHALTALTPGVNLDAGSPFSGDKSVLSASIRGIGQDDFAFNLNPGVGVYVDGIFLARTIGANVDLLDVDRVEILKGAQGTLFGANTIGGAINIVTHTPGNQFRVIATATGGSFNERNAGFTVDIPIISNTLLSSFTVSSRQQDGYQRVIPYPSDGPVGSGQFVVDPQDAFPKSGYTTGDSYGGTGVVAMRGKLLWNVTDKLQLTFTGDWTHEDQTALPEVVLDTFTGNLGSSTFSTLYNLCIANSAASLPGAVAIAGFVPGLPAAIQPFAVGAPNNGLFSGDCTQPRGRVPGISIGAAPLASPVNGGSGYVGIPAGATAFYAANPWVNPTYNYNNIAAYGNIPCDPANPKSYCGSNSPRLFFGYHDPVTGLDPVAQTGNVDTTYAANRPDFARQNVFGFSLTGVYQLSDNLQLKSITGYRQDLWDIGTQLDGTPATIQEVTDQQHQWQVSQEVQLLGKSLADRLNWVAGLYYFDEYGYVHDYVPFEGLLYVDDGEANNVQNTYYAAFLHLDYSLNDHWEFVAGGRYTDAQTYFLGGQGDLNSFPLGSALWQVVGPTTPVAQGGGGPYLLYFPDIPDSQAWHVFTPTGTIQYHFTPDVQAYVTWGKGFKQGGWTTRLSSVYSSPYAARFGPEYAKQWELGLKSEWFNHRLLANAAVFYTDYDGIQLNFQQGPSPVYMNAGRAKIKGAELEVQSVVGGGLSLNGSASFIDAYYTYVNPAGNIPEFALPDGTTVCPTTAINTSTGAPVCPVHVPGVTQTDAYLPKTPKWKFAFDPTYDFDLPNEAIIRFVPVFTYTSEMWNDSLNTPQLRRPATRMFDASLHYLSPSGMYDLAVGGTNLTDDRFFTAGAVNYSAGEVQGYINPPREWYATIRVTFDK